MDGKAPTEPGEQKCFLQVTSQRAGWTMQILFTLCLLHGLKAWLGERRSLQLAANALKGPRLVTGEPGGAVTIQCRYAPLSIYRHQRKYWCRLNPLTWICHTIVSTNSYTHRQYHGRVALTDFRHSGLFVVRLSQLSPDDVGYYRCGVGNQNDILFFSMNLTISAGPPSTLPAAAGELLTGSFGTATLAANRGTPGTAQTIERQGTGWERAAVTPGTSKTTASAKGRPSPGTAGAGAPGTDNWVDASLWATVSIPRSPAAATRGVSDMTEGVWVRGSRSSVAGGAGVSEREREISPEADRPGEETESIRIALDAARKVMGTVRPSALVSEKWLRETLREATSVSKAQVLCSTAGTSPSAGMWTLGPSGLETAAAEGSADRDLDTADGDRGPQATPNQAPASGPQRPLEKGSSMKSASPEEKSISRVLTPVSTMLLPLMFVALALLQRKLQRKQMSQEAGRAAGVTLVRMTHLLACQPDCPGEGPWTLNMEGSAAQTPWKENQDQTL
ncbi:high affinity immunoglobulin alpha and immunoglobulin mu Fc receptor [Manis pentadactyla]|uniref:high affinity immunoglobulin alpha and immunoglobulin mu Fc receptor n=1 Tax=Manis pentadactyla TaxID=143292 RepID=UPI00255CDD0A|nr:high affinity immunoglobulin alpha and immunoglobulin mu Fc receptor [Manis pentadactyla]